MVITDLTDANERSDKLGKLGLSYGIGMVVGPMIGGWCTKYASEQVAAFVAAAGSLFSIALVFFFIPTHTKVTTKEKDEVSLVKCQHFFNCQHRCWQSKDKTGVEK